MADLDVAPTKNISDSPEIETDFSFVSRSPVITLTVITCSFHDIHRETLSNKKLQLKFAHTVISWNSLNVHQMSPAHGLLPAITFRCNRFDAVKN
jgi:hypothetical protein